jgi:AraC family transcriptional regulator
MPATKTEELSTTMAIARSIMGTEPLFGKTAAGAVSFHIERYLCHLHDQQLPEIPSPVLIVQLGGKKISQRNSRQQTISFPSVSTIIPGIEPSAWQIRGALDLALIYFETEALERLRQALADRVQPVAFVDAVIGALTRQLVIAMATEEDFDSSYVQALANALLAHLCRLLARPREQHLLSSQNTQVNYVQRAIAFINDNFTRCLRADEIAAHIGLHASHFRRVFLEVTGTTPHQYLLHLRLERARDLLINSDMALVDIAAACGLSSQSHMTSSFRRVYDVTPRQYKARMLAQLER